MLNEFIESCLLTGTLTTIPTLTTTTDEMQTYSETTISILSSALISSITHNKNTCHESMERYMESLSTEELVELDRLINEKEAIIEMEEKPKQLEKNIIINNKSNRRQY